MTAILQVKLGFIVENAHAWLLTKRLIEEAVAVANAENQDFLPEQVIDSVRDVPVNAREVRTSIDADDGYGETPLNAYRTTMRIARAGAAALPLDDTTGFRGYNRWGARGVQRSGARSQKSEEKHCFRF